MQGKAQQEPAVAMLSVEAHTHAFVIGGGKRPTGLRFGVFCERGDDLAAIGGEVLRKERHAEFHAFRRLLQIGE